MTLPVEITAKLLGDLDFEPGGTEVIIKSLSGSPALVVWSRGLVTRERAVLVLATLAGYFAGTLEEVPDDDYAETVAAPTEGAARPVAWRLAYRRRLAPRDAHRPPRPRFGARGAGGGGPTANGTGVEP